MVTLGATWLATNGSAYISNLATLVEPLVISEVERDIDSDKSCELLDREYRCHGYLCSVSSRCIWRTEFRRWRDQWQT